MTSQSGICYYARYDLVLAIKIDNLEFNTKIRDIYIYIYISILIYIYMQIQKIFIYRVKIWPLLPTIKVNPQDFTY